MDWSPSATARQFAVELARPRAQMERAGAPDIHRFGWTTGAAARLVALAGRVGADPLESSDASLQRRLLVLMNVGTLPLTVLWSVTYFAAGPSPPRLLRFIRGTYDLIKDQFDCKSRGTIKVKGADHMEVWHVLGRKADPPPVVEGRA
jgi:hypothetical protein